MTAQHALHTKEARTDVHGMSAHTHFSNISKGTNASSADSMLVCTNVEKYFGTRTNITKALAGVSFTMKRGEFVGVMGPSGSGKSTLLNCISTIDKPTLGTITVNNQDVTRLRGRQLASFRRTQLGFIFQDSNLLETLTAYENIALPLCLSACSVRVMDEKVKNLASLLNIADVLKKYPNQMSGGQRQRVAAARALISDPAIVLADEPTGSLDSKNSRILLESFEEINHKRSASILMVTHDPFSASYASRIIFIKDGRVFNELVRGEKSRQAFFKEIMDVVSYLGGSDAALH